MQWEAWRSLEGDHLKKCGINLGNFVCVDRMKTKPFSFEMSIILIEKHRLNIIDEIIDLQVNNVNFYIRVREMEEAIGRGVEFPSMSSMSSTLRVAWTNENVVMRFLWFDPPLNPCSRAAIVALLRKIRVV
ncbi:hypothetical protein GQ457_07G010250 [Hibiscus cannabinus]